MGIWGKKKGGVRLEQEESGKLLSVKLSKKSGEPILGISFPKSEDRVMKLREQAKDLRGMAERLDLMADELERKAQGGKAVRFIRRVFRRGAPPEGK